MKYVAYNSSSGFYLVESSNENINDARDIDCEDIIDYESEFDSVILERIKELLD